jgi:hypothetical protein
MAPEAVNVDYGSASCGQRHKGIFCRSSHNKNTTASILTNVKVATRIGS